MSNHTSRSTSPGTRGDAVLVTGAATGLGKEMALHLAERGFRVYGTTRDVRQAEELQAVARSRGAEVRVLPLDVLDPESITSVVRTIVSECGGIFGVINNAGIGLRGYFEDLTPEEIHQVFAANVFGLMAVTKAALPYMRSAGRGRVLLISSVGGRIGACGVSAYCSTKFAVEGFGESLFQELAPLGIQVVLIEPGIIRTERWSVNRGLAKNALNPESPYRGWFQRLESESDELVRRSTATPADVAELAYRALTVRRPKLRYMVGWKAKLAVALKRWMPGELFERIYFGIIMRRVTRTTQS
jgi:NAD(P)-dependent dehydrogenase (short-subunit alcohol dehydrogenase family)